MVQGTPQISSASLHQRSASLTVFARCCTCKSSGSEAFLCPCPAPTPIPQSLCPGSSSPWGEEERPQGSIKMSSS